MYDVSVPMKPTKYMDTEIWKPLKEFPLYEVSSHGRIRSYHNNRHGVSTEPKILSPGVDGKYRLIHLRDPSGKRKKKRIHNLVCETFHPRMEGKTQVLHRDDNPLNNHMNNLYWGDYSDNIQDQIKNGLHNNQYNYRDRG